MQSYGQYGHRDCKLNRSLLVDGPRDAADPGGFGENAAEKEMEEIHLILRMKNTSELISAQNACPGRTHTHTRGRHKKV